MSRDLFFPTPVYYTDLEDADALNVELAAAIYAWREREPEGTVRSSSPQTGAWHSPTDMHVRREFDRLSVEIFELVQGVFDDLGYDRAYEPACDSMWANVNPPHGYNRHHTHPHALWSGVYYVHTPENCGLLYVSDPRPQAQVLTPHYDPQRRAADTWHEVHYQPQPGRLIVFPAWLVHAVQPNLAAGEGPGADRISVSFNFHQRRHGEPSAAERGIVVRADLAR